MTGTRWAIAVEDIPPAERLGAVHFVGVGGVGMSGIARINRSLLRDLVVKTKMSPRARSRAAA